MKYCFQCLHENNDNASQCNNCAVSLNGFFEQTYQRTKEFEMKSEKFWKQKDYANYIYASSLHCWYHAIAVSIIGNEINPSEYVTRYIITNHRKAKAFKKLDKEEAQGRLKEFLLEIFLKFDPLFKYIFEVSDYYQNPSVWSKNNNDRVDPNDIINGEKSNDRIIRLISKDKKCIIAIHKILSFNYQKEIRDKLLELLS